MDGVRLWVGCKEGKVMYNVCECGQVAKLMQFVAEEAKDYTWIAVKQEVEEVNIIEANFAYS